jgi:lauroyl/myristoyl acyltransferase
LNTTIQESDSSRHFELTRRLALRIDHFVYPLLIVPLVALLPARLAYGVAVLRGDLIYRWNTVERREIAQLMESNLECERAPLSLDQLLRDYYRMISCSTIDAMRLLGEGKALTGLVRIDGIEHIRTALANGRGAVLCSAHFGSAGTLAGIDVIGASGFPITLVGIWSSIEDLNRPVLRRILHRLSGQDGRGRPVNFHLSRPVIQKSPGTLGVAVRAAAALRENELVGILIDVSAKPGDLSRPIPVTFLKTATLIPPGAVRIAQLTGAPLMMMMIHRIGDYRHQVLEISSPIRTNRDTAEVFADCLAYVVARIKRFPSQYVWKEDY